MSTNDSKLFSSIKYFTTGFRDPTVETTFKQNGAIRSFYLTETTTHVICDDFDSNKSELEQAIEIYQTPIVNSEWIIACLKCNTLLPIEPFRSDDGNNSEHLFRSCIFANANLPNEDHNKIYALVTYYGGRWTTNLDDPNCTHIICASSLSTNSTDDETTTTTNHQNLDERLHQAYELQSEKIRLITPDWIIDCLNSNRLLEENEYHPDLLRDPNEPMDIDEDDLDDEQNISMNNNQSTDEHTPTKTTTSTHRSQLITKNFFNQSDQTTPPPSAEPVSGINDGSNPPDSSVRRNLFFRINTIDIVLFSRIHHKQNLFHPNDLVLEQLQQHHDNVIQKQIPQQIQIYIQIKMVIHQHLKMLIFQLYQLKKS